MGKFISVGFVVLSLTVLSVLADASDPAAEIGKFRNTMYWVAQESDYSHLAIDDVLLDMEDQVLAKVAAKFRKAALLEGTAKLLDGRVVNYAGVKDGISRFHVTVHPWGRGVGDCPLVPFHTIAADPARIPLGSVVEIPETQGMLLPDGSKHDGIWLAEDIGGAIQGDRIDLFIGEKSNGKLLVQAGITHLKPLTVRLISAPGADPCHEKPPR